MRPQEGGDGDLVGGVEHGRRAAAGDAAPARASAGPGKRSGSGASKVSGRELREIEPLRRRRHALGPGQRIGDRRAHVGRAELGQHRAVGIVDQAVDDRLRMDQDVDAGRSDRKR